MGTVGGQYEKRMVLRPPFGGIRGQRVTAWVSVVGGLTFPAASVAVTR